jgi:hypothetical protein
MLNSLQKLLWSRTFVNFSVSLRRGSPQRSIYRRSYLGSRDAEDAFRLVVNKAAITWTWVAVEGILHSLKWCLPRIPNICVRRSKQDYGWNAKRSGQMSRPAVVADK